jgi:hypothetical protein
MKIPVTILSIIIYFSLFSQSKFNLASIKDSPFKEDSFQTFQNEFSQFKELGSLKSSDAEFEFRYYQTPAYARNSTIIYQVKYKKGNFEKNVFFINDYFLNIDLNTVDLLGDYKGRHFYRKKIYDLFNLDTFFNTSSKYGLLFLPDQKKLIDSLKSRGMSIYHWNNNLTHVRRTHAPGGFDFIEIKVDKKIRNFRIAQQPDGYYFFNEGVNIFQLFYNLFVEINRVFNYSLINTKTE